MDRSETIEYIERLKKENEELLSLMCQLSDFIYISFPKKGGWYDIKGGSWFEITAEHMIDFMDKERKTREEAIKDLIVGLWEEEQ